jgi:diguanylate cyclase (GGDEF)-like protein
MNTKGDDADGSVIVPASARGGTQYSPLDQRLRRDSQAAAVLIAQAGTRMSVAVAFAVLQLGLLHRVVTGAGIDRTLGAVVAAVLAYVTAVAAIRKYARHACRASPMLVNTSLVLDLSLVFTLTVLTTTPDHYERTLLGTIVVVHVANYYHGRAYAWRMVQLGTLGYLLLIASAVERGLRVEVAEEVFTLAMCVAATALFVIQASDVRRRLRNIVSLFEMAEVGDFSREYDAGSDGRPDAITRVGLAYNAVRAQLANMVLTDPLTACLNRRGFDNALTRELSRAGRAGTEFALLAVDLDHFKAVNDNFGHIAGDAVLRAVGNLLMTSARAGDVVARVGGEEFAVLLADTGAEGAHLFAGRLCERIAAHHFAIGTMSHEVRITTSVGVAVSTMRGAADYGQLLWSRADDALYEAKRAGRNRVRLWTGLTRRSGDYATIHGSIPAESD